MKKLILHIPHSSNNIEFLDGYVADENKIQQEIIKLIDWCTDKLFHSEKDTMIVAPFSRLFCDVERFVNDKDEVMSKVGMGAVYERFKMYMRFVTLERLTEYLNSLLGLKHFSVRTKAICHAFVEELELRDIHYNVMFFGQERLLSYYIKIVTKDDNLIVFRK